MERLEISAEVRLKEKSVDHKPESEPGRWRKDSGFRVSLFLIIISTLYIVSRWD